MDNSVLPGRSFGLVRGSFFGKDEGGSAVAKRRSLRVVAVGIAVAAFVPYVGVQSALGAASGKASCAGIEASNISPPGSSDEVPGGMRQLVSFVKAEAGKFGPVWSSFAKEHAGSHAACDIAG